ncbi:hypothetical protein [Clostridium scatologenes]|uniref:Uncharacterized protein n=1 Tax=Clostridium scatologenes TaxID=1548 RepID=A0A0E3MA93_CLOSL|nr:hypothetical protein [Clostridium scatologenes]AKA70357.1 hypothetical protein CSCA_3232 [Clostridium scatologenes]
MKKIIILTLKVVLLVMIMFITISVSSILIGVKRASQPSGNSLIPILIYCILNTLILTLFIVKSKLRDYKLAAVSFIVFWGIQYFMTQIETIYFNSSVKMPLTELIKNVTSGAIYTSIFSLLAVFILGKFKKETNSSYSDVNIKISIINAIPNMIILALIYDIIYFIFGYFIAWQFADLRYYYTGSTHIVNVFQHISNQFRQDPVLILFQFSRGFLWSVLAVIIIDSLGIENWMTYITTGLLFSILITTPLIFPNAYMPIQVRIGHSFELSTSMFVFGVISVITLKNKLASNKLMKDRSL